MIKASHCKGDQRTAATIRTISPHDFELERQFIESLSPTTGYRRLFSPRRPTDEEIRRFTSIDPSREFALIAIVGNGADQRMVGVGRWVKPSADANVAEFALVVADDWQGKGLGTKIFERPSVRSEAPPFATSTRRHAHRERTDASTMSQARFLFREATGLCGRDKTQCRPQELAAGTWL